MNDDKIHVFPIGSFLMVPTKRGGAYFTGFHEDSKYFGKTVFLDVRNTAKFLRAMRSTP